MGISCQLIDLTYTMTVCGVVSEAGALKQIAGKLATQQKRAAHLKDSIDKWIIHNAYSAISICVCAHICVSGVERQCHFDGLFHFFSTLYESAGKFAGTPNKGQCVRPQRGSGEELDTCGMASRFHKRPSSHVGVFRETKPLSPGPQSFCHDDTLSFSV